MKITNLTIKLKLIFIAISITLILCGTGVISYLYIQKVHSLADLITTVRELTIEIIQLRRSEKEFLLRDNTNLNFFKNGKSTNITTFNEHFGESKFLLNTIKTNTNYIDSVRFAKINNNLDIYKTEFEELTENTKTIGFMNIGLIGELRKNAREIEKSIKKKSSRNDLLILILELRRNEKDFLIRNNLDYSKNLNSNIEKFKQKLSDSDNTELYIIQENKNLLKTIIKYENTFNQIVKLKEKIGLSYEVGLIDEIQNRIYTVEQEIADIAKLIETQSEKAIEQAIFTLFIVILLIAIGVVITLLFISKSITEPIAKMKTYILELVKGKLPENLKLTTKDEVSEMASSLDIFTESLRSKSEFAEKIGEGILNAKFSSISTEDTLGNSLLEMRNSLKTSKQEVEERKLEDEKRNWATIGIAKFNDILRQSSKNIEELAYTIINNLIKYLKANQGGIFLLNNNNNEDIYFELIASVAFDRRKYLEKKIANGVGLIGNCAQEKETIYLTDIPNNYIEITSGFGKANPKCLILVPLTKDDEVLGVIELASFNELNKNEIDFIVEVAANIASTLSNAKMNKRTNELLQKFQFQSEELASKEEEMRQNLEEMQTIREELGKKEEEAAGFVNSVNHTQIRADYNLDGTLRYANSKMCYIMGYKFKEIKNKDVLTLLQEDYKESFQLEWANLISGGKHYEKEINFKTKTGTHWLLATYTCVRNNHGEVVSILFLANDISKSKQQEEEVKKILKDSRKKSNMLITQEEELRQNLEELQTTQEILAEKDKEQKIEIEKLNKENKAKLDAMAQKDIEIKGHLDAINNTLATAELDMNGFFLDANNQFLSILGYPLDNIKGKHHRLLCPDDYVNSFAYTKLWNNLKTGVAQFDEYIFITKNKQEKWFNASYTTVLDSENKPSKIFMLATDITKDKQKYLDDKGKLNAISKSTALIEFNIDGTIMNANRIFLDLVDYTLEEIIDENYKIFFNPEFINTKEYKILWEKLKAGKFYANEFNFNTKKEKSLWIHGSYNPVFDYKGNLYKIIGYLNNITKRKLMEIETKKQAEQLALQEDVMRQNLEGLQIMQSEMIQKQKIMEEKDAQNQIKIKTLQEELENKLK